MLSVTRRAGYNAPSVLSYTHSYNYAVLGVWLGQWGLLVAFSLFARFMARYDERWAEWCLLPAYDCAIVFKKMGLVLMLVSIGWGSTEVSADSKFGFGAWMSFFVAVSAQILYQFTYVTVLYVLWAPSGGTRTMLGSIATTLVLAIIAGLLATFNYAGDINMAIQYANTEYNTTYWLWPSFTGGDHIGPSGLTVQATPQVEYSDESWAAAQFWLFIMQAAVGAVLGLGVIARLWSPPRQPRLFAALYVLFLLTAFGNYLAYWQAVKDAFGFNPLVLWGVIEVPVKYYIMLMDSQVSPCLPCPPCPRHTHHLWL